MAEHESLFGLQEEGHRDLKLTTLEKERAEFNSGNKRRSGLGGKGIRGHGFRLRQDWKAHCLSSQLYLKGFQAAVLRLHQQ